VITINHDGHQATIVHLDPVFLNTNKELFQPQTSDITSKVLSSWLFHML